jgi:release factor glutamine methyltransferase
MLPETTDRHLLLRAAAACIPGDTPRLDAELLLAAVLGEERLRMLAEYAPIAATQRQAFAALLARRQRHEPVAYLLGVREFWSLPIRVTPDVLIPRPDSETLIAAALGYFRDLGRAPDSILDLGTGSGALLLAALSEWPRAQGLGVDIAPAAIAVAQDNALRLGLQARARFRQGDWASGIDTRFDLLLCNPPYIESGAVLMPDVARFEPVGALFAGADGLDCYRRILPELARLLTVAGAAFLEIGSGQFAAVATMARRLGLQAAGHRDLAGHLRVVQIAAEPALATGKTCKTGSKA